MRLQALRLPWQDQWVPHGLLDILRGCNLACRACYNTASPATKTLKQVQEEFEVLARHRRLDSVGIVGGEPTLHPQLPEIIRMIKSAGISVELFTNGLLLESKLLAELKSAGTDLIFLHIDPHQNRPDLPEPTPGALQSLWAAKAATVVAAGMEVGLAITAYANALADIDLGIRFVLSSPHLDYLLVTLHRNTARMGMLTGDLHAGIQGTANDVQADECLTNKLMYSRLREQFGLLPFAYIGSNVDSNDPRWLSYLIGSIIGEDGVASSSMLKASGAERLILAMYRRLLGRYPFYLKQSPAQFRLHLLLNALGGGSAWTNLRLLARSLRRGRTLRTKRLLFQCPAELRSDGKLIHCNHCPDATVRQGRLVPVCISDQIVGERS